MARSSGSVVDEASSTLPRREEEVQRASYAAAESWVTIGSRLKGTRNREAGALDKRPVECCYMKLNESKVDR